MYYDIKLSVLPIWVALFERSGAGGEREGEEERERGGEIEGSIMLQY